MWAPILVREAIEDRVIARRPDERRKRAGYSVGQQFAGFEVADARLETLGAIVVERIGHQLAVRADGQFGEAEIILARHHRDLVELGRAAWRERVCQAV